MKGTVVITGANRGIGFELAKYFLANDFKVIGTSRAGIISSLLHQNLIVVTLDLFDTATIDKAVNQIAASCNGIDILINNAGIGPDCDTLLPDEKSFDQTFDVNTKGAVFFTEAVLKLMNDNGKIVNVSSKMGSIELCTGMDAVAYRMSKAALNMYTKILANRLLGKQTVAAIHPGWVRTNFSPGNINAPLSAQDSAIEIFKFCTGNFKTGVYWNVVTREIMEW
jgi:NAD(P)-dependent dehydrogenase (short-subunit alcohol dehydrogenase family)